MSTELEPMNLGDVNTDLSGWAHTDFEEREPMANGHYKAEILRDRTVTKDGNAVTYDSKDTPSQHGDSRNITLQLRLTTRDGQRVFNMMHNINYRTSDFTADSIAQLNRARTTIERKQGDTWNSLGVFRLYSAVSSIATLAQLAGLKQLNRTGEGGFDLTPLFGKTVYAYVGDDRSEKNAGKGYKEVKELALTPPKKAALV